MDDRILRLVVLTTAISALAVLAGLALHPRSARDRRRLAIVGAIVGILGTVAYALVGQR